MSTTEPASLGRRLQAFGRRHPLTPIAVGVVLYSTGPVFVRASSVSGPVFSFWRLWFGAATFVLAAVIHRRVTGERPDLAAWRTAGLAGIAFGAHQLLLFSALKATSVVDVTLVNTLSPIVTGLLAVPMFAERPGPAFRAWSLLAMVGAAVVVAGASAGPEGSPVGMVLALGNVFAFALFFLLSKRSRDHMSVVPFLAGVFTVAAVFVSGYITLVGEHVTTAHQLDLVYAAAVAVGPGAFGHFAMTWPLQWVPANVPPVMRLGIPVLAATWAWWLLGEQIGVIHLVGGAVTMAGVAGAVLSPSGRRFITAEATADEEA